jgi:bifunctional non-homologous end joining protein LigD
MHSVLCSITAKPVLDGEIVALGPDGVPSFSLLQRRMHVLRPTAQLRNEAVTSYYVFDVLDVDGTSTTELPYLDRYLCRWRPID